MQTGLLSARYRLYCPRSPIVSHSCMPVFCRLPLWSWVVPPLVTLVDQVLNWPSAKFTNGPHAEGGRGLEIPTGLCLRAKSNREHGVSCAQDLRIEGAHPFQLQAELSSVMA